MRHKLLKNTAIVGSMTLLVACAEFAKRTAPVISSCERRRTMRISVAVVNMVKPVRIFPSAGKLLF